MSREHFIDQRLIANFAPICFFPKRIEHA